MAPRTSERYQTPVPKKDVEQRTSGCGPVITYKLSDEELARYRALPAPKPRDPDGELINRPVVQREKTIERERPMDNTVQAAEQEASGRTVTKTDYLRLRAAGKTHTEIEDTLRLARGTISSYWLRKWGLKGITAEKAQKLLGEQPAANDTPTVAAESPEPEPVLGLLAFNEQRESKEREIRQLREELAKVLNENKELQLANQVMTDEYYEAVEVQRELETERDALLQTIERAMAEGTVPTATPDPRHDVGDPVNHPVHYTAGEIECIDAIEAATVGLTGGQAYNTGAAIKYLWRWSRKGGVEDLRKARWYIDRLIAGLGG